MKNNLSKTIFLFLDFQTTGPNPAESSVIEIGWMRSDKILIIESHLIRLPEGLEIPARVKSITGICEEGLLNGSDPEIIWNLLLSESDEIKRKNCMDKCPVIIHYSSFEKAFIQNFQEKYSKNKELPFILVCTHLIAKKLYPELPRKSLRAVSGYLGHSLGELRRCKDHIFATSYIWHSMIGTLQKQNITTLKDLLNWCNKPPTPKKTSYPMDRKFTEKLPNAPGVYYMKRNNGDILYIGKASSIKNRVRSYFHKSRSHSEHILEMLSQAKVIDFSETSSILESALKESDQIKQHAPPYNIALRHNKREICFFSKDFLSSATHPDSIHRLGPFSSKGPVNTLRAILNIIPKGDHYSNEELLQAIGISGKYKHDIHFLKTGYFIFRNKYKKISDLNSLKTIGREIWLIRKEETDEIPESDPRAICHILESNIMAGTYEIRKNAWLLFLSESSLYWKEDRNGETMRYFMVFKKGKIFEKGLWTEVSKGPFTPMPIQEKQNNFDIIVLDRMRVLTTEIRKIISSGRFIVIISDSGKSIGIDNLRILYNWI